MKTLFSRWIAALLTRRSVGNSARQRRTRLGVEALEVRDVPAVFATGATPQLIATGDFNGDARGDVAVTNFDGQSVSILLSDENGELKPSATIALGASPEGITTARLRGPGGPLDLVTANTFDGSVSILSNDGNGNFTAKRIEIENAGGGHFFTYLAAGPLKSAPNAADDLVLADFNNDKVFVLENDGEGGLVPTPVLALEAPGQLVNAEQIVLADFNGDDRLDVAVASQARFEDGQGGVVIFANQSDENGMKFGEPLFLATGANHGDTGLAAGDFDNDGRMDLATANFGFHGAKGSVSVLSNQGEQGGDIRFEVRSTIAVGEHLVNVAAADFDGDGQTDLAVTSHGPADGTSPDNKVYLLRNVLVGESDYRFEQAGTIEVGNNPTGAVPVALTHQDPPGLAVANEADGTLTVLSQVSFSAVEPPQPAPQPEPPPAPAPQPAPLPFARPRAGRQPARGGRRPGRHGRGPRLGHGWIR